MGSRSKTDLAYIAGFLDGDGSLMLQVKHRKDGRLKRRFMCTICLYQDRRHGETLHWIRSVLGIGYVSQRRDGISELRINGFQQVRTILAILLPFIRFKRAQAEALLHASTVLSTIKGRRLDDQEILKIVDDIMTIQSQNYVTRRKRSRAELLQVLGLTP